MKSILELKWTQELGILLFSFILFTLNDWILIATWKSFFLGTVYFMLLYSHAQINRYLLLPIMVRQHNTFLYILLTLGLLLVFTFILTDLVQTVLYTNCFLHKDTSKLTFQYQCGVLLGSCICILGTAQFLDYYRRQKETSKKELLDKKNQIDLLNKQLNPHFLFNTLNTIYGLSIKYPDKTADAIIKVSDLLRYQIDTTSKDLVSLQDEISFINSYIELEKERVGYRCDISFTYDNKGSEHYYIAPMIVFTFIENAFKHGTSNIDHCFVHIDFSVKNGTLILNIQNSIPLKSNDLPSTKMGLENTRERLKMIYPNRYDLRVGKIADRFETYLEIKL